MYPGETDMNDKRSSLPAPMIIGKRPSQRTELAHSVHEKAQKGYAQDRVARRTILDSAGDPPEGIGRGTPVGEKVK
jgi:hypothetical protein